MKSRRELKAWPKQSGELTSSSMCTERTVVDSRGKSGEGVRISVQNDTPIFRKFNQILSIDENKSELNSLIADTTIELCHGVDSVVVMTKGEDVLSNHEIERRNIEPCAKEEADDRMFLRAMAISRAGHTKLCIISPDSDVIIIALYAFWHLDVDELWVEYGVGKDRRWLPIHIIHIIHIIRRIRLSCSAFLACLYRM